MRMRYCCWAQPVLTVVRKTRKKVSSGSVRVVFVFVKEAEGGKRREEKSRLSPCDHQVNVRLIFESKVTRMRRIHQFTAARSAYGGQHAASTDD